MRDTRHFLSFLFVFRGLRSKTLVFVDRVSIRHSRHFRQNPLFSVRGKRLAKTPLLSSRNTKCRSSYRKSLQLWETDLYTPPVLRGAAIFDNSAAAVYKIPSPKDPEFYTPLALNCQKGERLPAPEVYKNLSPKLHLAITKPLAIANGQCLAHSGLVFPFPLL